LAFVAACNAGVANYNGAAIIAPTYTSESQNVLRSYGNQQQISYNSKTIDTPYSSVSKSDVRVSNPGIQIHKPIAYAAAPAHTTYIQQQPAYQTYQAPIVHQAPIVASAPAVVHSAPAPIAYAAQPAYAAPAAYAAPGNHHKDDENC
jgi:hypothetical protein